MAQRRHPAQQELVEQQHRQQRDRPMSVTFRLWRTVFPLVVSSRTIPTGDRDAQKSSSNPTAPPTPTWYADTLRSKKFESSWTSWSSMKASAFEEP